MRPYTLSKIRYWSSLPSFAPLGPDGPNSLASEAQSLHLPFLPYEKFLALWRGSLPADLVYELQFSFNFQLPVVKDRTRLRSKSFGEVNDLQKRTLEKTANARVPPSLPEGRCLLRKEVIQPLVPQRLPCYDFIPITTHTLGRQMPDFGCRRLS